MIYKKSVVLTCVNGGKQKGVLTLEYDEGETLGTVKLYNFDKELEGILSLGILSDNQVYKAGLIKDQENVYNFKLSGVKNLNTFSCALVNLYNGVAKPLLMGATNKNPTTEERLANSLCILEDDPNLEKTEQTLNDNEIYLEDQEQIDDFIDQQIETTCKNNCSECKYRDAFFKQEDKIISQEEQEINESFFDGIKEQIDILFEKYPEEEILKQIIPESKWVKIDYQEKGEYYVVGVLYEQDKIKYVCYGVPSMFSSEPPEELNGYAQWLPIDSTKQNGFGYWLTYQDADTGENIQLNFETM